MARVLVVDDNATVRLMARAMLEAGGFQVAEASDGAEALHAFCLEPADVILCDIFMPEKDGLQTIRELRALKPNVKIVAMSGVRFQRGIDVLGMARAFGAAETLTKPFDRAALVAAVERALHAPAVA
jgi:two-component system chemotaxis response regulator CheY